MPETAERGPGFPPAGSEIRRRVVSAVEFDVLWSVLGLGPTPVVLALPSPGRTHTERRRIVADASARLRDRGLVGSGSPEPVLGGLLRLLAAPAQRVELRIWGRTPVRAVVARRDDTAVLACRRGDDVAIAPCTSVPTAAVGLLAPAPPGPGRTASAPTATLDAALDRPSGAGLRADLVDRGLSPDDAGPLARMLHGITDRAQLGVLVADRWGTLRRSAEVLDVLDGPHGRHLVVRRDGWTTVAPTDDRNLRHRVDELLTAAATPSAW